MFKKIIKFLLESGGYTEDSLASALGRSQSTINRIKQGQEPRHSDGEKLKGLHEQALKEVAAKK
jgi:transcriptional regulator with XRE-family HTH domain